MVGATEETGERVRRSRRSRWLGALALVGLGFALLLAWGILAHDPLFSDPSAVRDAAALEELKTVNREVPSVDVSVLESMQVETNEGTIEIRFPYRNGGIGAAGIYRHTVHEFSADETLMLGEGVVMLDHVGIAYGEFEGPSSRYSVSLPGRFFDGSLREMKGAEIEGRLQRWERELDFRGRYPEVSFGVRVEGLGPTKLLGGKVYDVRTGRSISSGYSLRMHEGMALIETEVQMWHPAPVLLVADVAHGPVEEILIEPRPGATVEHQWGSLHLMWALDGESRSWGSSSDGNEMKITLRLSEKSTQPHGTFVFVALPQANPLPLDVEFLGVDGHTLPGAGGGSSDLMKVQSVRAECSAVAMIRVKRYTQVKRFLIRLPEIPGLPEENRGVENLFDVRIPFLRLRQDYHLRETLGHVLQMTAPSGSTVMPSPLVFPQFYTNATPRDLFRDFERLQPKGSVLIVDQEKQQIRSERPVWEEWLKKLRRALGL